MWTNEEINRLKSQHGHGWSVEESADILGRSPLDVRNKLIALGFKPIEETTPAPKKTARKRKHKLTESDKNRVITMRDNGYSLNDIIANTDISLASVQRILRESGRTTPHNIQAIKPADTKIAEKCAELEKRILDAESVIKNQAQMISDKNNELYKALRQVEELQEMNDETADKPKEAADNWSVKELKNVLELLEPLTIDNGADAMTIGEAIGRLKMMISIAYETERRHGF